MASAKIQAVDRSTVARICSGQVVVELSTAVKELVENSIDAGASKVEVKLRDHGTMCIEVSDNGVGISPDNYAGLTAKYHTSKLSSFDDLQSVTSFGFRGEAVSSLCELASSFVVTTRTAGQPQAVRLTYSRTGALLTQEPAAHPVGTTVTVTELFTPLPVRRQELLRSAKKHYAKMLRVLQAYAIVATNVRLSVSNVVAAGGKGAKAAGNKPPPQQKQQQVLSTQGKGRMTDNVANVFGPKFLATLVPFSVAICEVEGQEGGEGGDREEAEEEESSTDVAASVVVTPRPTRQRPRRRREVVGLVSKCGSGVGRSDNDRQFFFLNGRPIDHPPLTKALNETWRQFEMKHKPACFLDLRVPAGDFDVNLTPDKRQVLLGSEKKVVASLRAALVELWKPSRNTFPVNSAAVGGGVGGIGGVGAGAGREEDTAAVAGSKSGSLSDSKENDDDNTSSSSSSDSHEPATPTTAGYSSSSSLSLPSPTSSSTSASQKSDAAWSTVESSVVATTTAADPSTPLGAHEDCVDWSKVVGQQQQQQKEGTPVVDVSEGNSTPCQPPPKKEKKKKNTNTMKLHGANNNDSGSESDAGGGEGLEIGADDEDDGGDTVCSNKGGSGGCSQGGKEGPTKRNKTAKSSPSSSSSPAETDSPSSSSTLVAASPAAAAAVASPATAVTTKKRTLASSSSKNKRKSLKQWVTASSPSSSSLSTATHLKNSSRAASGVSSRKRKIESSSSKGSGAGSSRGKTSNRTSDSCGVDEIVNVTDDDDEDGYDDGEVEEKEEEWGEEGGADVSNFISPRKKRAETASSCVCSECGVRFQLQQELEPAPPASGPSDHHNKGGEGAAAGTNPPLRAALVGAWRCVGCGGGGEGRLFCTECWEDVHAADLRTRQAEVGGAVEVAASSSHSKRAAFQTLSKTVGAMRSSGKSSSSNGNGISTAPKEKGTWEVHAGVAAAAAAAAAEPSVSTSCDWGTPGCNNPECASDYCGVREEAYDGEDWYDDRYDDRYDDDGEGCDDGEEGYDDEEVEEKEEEEHAGAIAVAGADKSGVVSTFVAAAAAEPSAASTTSNGLPESDRVSVTLSLPVDAVSGGSGVGRFASLFAKAKRVDARRHKRKSRLLAPPPPANPPPRPLVASTETAGGGGGGGGGEEASSAEATLERVLSKNDFAHMQVLGQFNLGFIVCRLRGDLFVLDQHACEEKYNFETLQRTTKVHQQTLIAPRTLELSASEEEVILEHLKVFQFNGFQLKVQGGGDDDDDGSGGGGNNRGKGIGGDDDDDDGGGSTLLAGRRVQVVSVPYSKTTTFGDEDIRELASMLADNPFAGPVPSAASPPAPSAAKLAAADTAGGGGFELEDKEAQELAQEHAQELAQQAAAVPRLPKILSMFASRACRASVMVGTALDRSSIARIVKRLQGIDQPWNCPHGRPTMRHLADVTRFAAAACNER